MSEADVRKDRTCQTCRLVQPNVTGHELKTHGYACQVELRELIEETVRQFLERKRAERSGLIIAPAGSVFR